MTDHFETTGRRAWRQGIAIDGECVFQSTPGGEITKFLSGIGDARNSEQVTLLADAVARRELELRRIHDRARAWIGEVPFYRTVATFAGDRLCGENRRPILIES